MPRACPQGLSLIHIFIKIEKPIGVVVAFGGQTAIKLTKTLADNNIPILGSSADKMCIRDRASSTPERYVVRPEGEVKKKIDLLDFGLKKNIYRELVKRGAEVTVCPCTTTAQEIAAMGVDGIMLSNGPGDPAENTEIIANLKEICKLNIPLFGICLLYTSRCV